MFDSAQDIMYMSIALGVLLVTVALTWLIITVISIIRDTRVILKKTKETLAAAQEVVQSIKHKVEDVSANFTFLMSGMTSVLDWIDKRRHPVGTSETQDQNTKST